MAALWTTQRERGNPALIGFFTRLALSIGRRFARLLLVPTVLYFLVAGRAASRASRDYLRRVLGREPTLVDRYRHLYCFAAVTLDRLYFLNDRHDLFTIDVAGAAVVRRALFDGLEGRERRGAFVIGAHIGSFEAVRAAGRGEAALRVSMVMYEDNAQALNRTLAAINPSLAEAIIPLGRVDSMLRVKRALDEGRLVGMLADRTLGEDAGAPNADTVRTFRFLGAPITIPTGPFRMAAMMKRPVVFIVGLYRGDARYEVRYEELFDFSQATDSRQAIATAMQRYVERLEHYCRSAPYNWFNFYDYWHRPGDA